MPNSIRKSKAKKPAKPYPEFPLFPHATRRWAKKIRGQIHYFGPWADPDGALRKYLEQRDDLHAGRTPRPETDRVTLRNAVNHFLTDRQRRVDSGELTMRSWQDYHRACDRLLHVLGKDRLVEDLRPDDFATLRTALSKTLGPTALTAAIARVRVLLNHAFQNELIDRPVRFGTAFERPPKRLMRQARSSNGPRMFEAAEIRKLIDAANPTLRAMLLLAVNGGFGPADVGRMTMDALDLDGGWIELARQKTGIPRRCPLWPETVVAIKKALSVRPKPREEALADRVFLTSHGTPWFLDTVDGPLGTAMRTLLRRTGLYQRGRGFYGLRRSFRTIADEAKDQPAANAIMGHADSTMADHYRVRISDDRLRAVTDHVRRWLFETDERK